MPHLNITEHKEGVWTVEADPELANKDLTDFATKSPEEQIEYVLEDHARIHFLKGALQIVEENSHEGKELIAVEMFRLNISIMINALLRGVQQSNDAERMRKVVKLSECWFAEENKEFQTVPLN